MAAERSDIISQRSIAGGPLFHFNSYYLQYCGVEWELNSKYEDIGAPSQYMRCRTQDRLVVFIFVYLLILALVLLSRDHQPHFGAEGARWLVRSVLGFVGVAIAICGPIYFLTHREYTVVPTRNGNLLVVRDYKHDSIIERLQAERLARLRTYAEPNLANSPEEELGKLKWLYDEGAISESEYKYRCDQTAASDDDRVRPSIS